MKILVIIIPIGRRVSKMEQFICQNISVKLPDGFKAMAEEEVKLYYNNTKFDSAFIENEKKAVLGIMDYEDRELFLTFSCDLQDAQTFMFKILKIVEDIFKQIEVSA